MADPAAIFALANKPTVALQDPNTVMGNALSVQNAANQNRLFQAQVARGNALAQAVDPQTGRLDPLMAQRLAAQDPAAAAAMPQMAEQSQALQGAQQTQSVQLQQVLGQGISAALDAPDSTIHAAAIGTLARLQAAGLDPQRISALAQQMSNDPTQLRGQLRQIQLGLQAPGAQQEQIFGTPGAVVDGQTNQPTVTQSAARGGGRVNAPGATTLQTSPEFNDGLVEVPVPGKPGQTQWITRRDAANQAQGAQPGGAIPPMRVPAPAANPSTAVPAAPAGGQPSTGLTPAPATPTPPQPFVQQSPASAASQLASAKLYSDAVAGASDFRQRQTTLFNAAQALQAAKTGNGSEALQNIASRIQTLTPDSLSSIMPNIRTPDQIAAYDEAAKYTEQLRRQVAGGSGRSDQDQASAGKASPGLSISPQAAQLLLQAETARQRMAHAQLLDFQHQPGSAPEGYGSYISGQGQELDPRAFITDQQTPAQKAAVINSLKPGSLAEKRYFESYKKAKDLHLIDMTGK